MRPGQIGPGALFSCNQGPQSARQRVVIRSGLVSQHHGRALPLSCAQPPRCTGCRRALRLPPSPVHPVELHGVNPDPALSRSPILIIMNQLLAGLLCLWRKIGQPSVIAGVLTSPLPFGLGRLYDDFIRASPTLQATKLLTTRVGSVVLAAGVGNDVSAASLALTVALANASTGPTGPYILAPTIAWRMFLFPAPMMTTSILLVIISAWMTGIIGVHAIFGASLVYLTVSHEGGYSQELRVTEVGQWGSLSFSCKTASVITGLNRESLPLTVLEV
ncbi:hypothetical protein V8E36_003990 [Tilletia maclaganii]